MKNKKAFAIFLAKPILYLLYCLIIIVFLIYFTAAGLGSSGRDGSIVSDEMPNTLSTIEAMNYLKKPVQDTTVLNLLTKCIKEQDYLGTIDCTELETKTNNLITLERYDLEETPPTVTIAIDKPGKLEEIEFFLPSNLQNHKYIKLIVEIPYQNEE